MPQPAGYAYPGFGTYGSFPGQTAGTPGAAGAGSPGMPQPAAAPGAGLGLTAGQQPNADPNAVAGGQAGQAQWGGADPSSYYNNYWGGKSADPLCNEPYTHCVVGYYGQAAGQPGGDTQMQPPVA